MTQQPPRMRKAIASLGTTLGPDVLKGCQALFSAELEALGGGRPPSAADVSYGTHPRQRLDLYLPERVDGEAPVPVVLFVHGGGFVRGDKRAPDDPFNAHVGRWAARHGFVGAVMNYRLAPEFTWPSGGEDVGAAVDWLRQHAPEFGGDPARIVLMGTSAGAVHVATFLRLRADRSDVAAAVLLSGLYGSTPMDGPDPLYFGNDALTYASRATLPALAGGSVPLLLACSEFDPPRFQLEFVAALDAVFRRRGRLPRAFYGAGHNHYSLAMHLGTSDARLSDAILEFLADVLGAPND